MLQTLGKTVGLFLKRHTAIPVLGIYSREIRTCIHTKTCARIFVTAKSENNPNVNKLVNG